MKRIATAALAAFLVAGGAFAALANPAPRGPAHAHVNSGLHRGWTKPAKKPIPGVHRRVRRGERSTSRR